MGRQGCNLEDVTINAIIRLLASTDLQIAEIAQRIGCSGSVVASINRKYRIRLYKGKRSTWSLAA
jgi:hypothetical protein